MLFPPLISSAFIKAYLISGDPFWLPPFWRQKSVRIYLQKILMKSEQILHSLIIREVLILTLSIFNNHTLLGYSLATGMISNDMIYVQRSYFRIQSLLLWRCIGKYYPRDSISRYTPSKIPALGKSLGPQGIHFPIHPSSQQCTDTLLHMFKTRNMLKSIPLKYS